MLDILRMAKNEELAVKMIFSAEQPLTGMNEGTRSIHESAGKCQLGLKWLICISLSLQCYA